MAYASTPRKHIVETVCLECANTSTTTNFYHSKSKHNKQTKVLFICKKCCHKQYNNYYKDYKDHNYCIFLMCRLVNYPYKLNFAQAATNEYVDHNRGETPFANYMKYQSLQAKQNKLKLNEFTDGETEYNPIEKSDGFIVTEEMEYKWGSNFPLADYEFLQKRYLEYYRNVDTSIRTMESLVEEICHTELLIRRARENQNTDIKVMKDMNDILQKLLTSAGLDSKSKREMDNSDALETYGLRIKEIEENQPSEIFEDATLFKDFDGIVSLFKRYIFRPLKNLVIGSKDFNVTTDDLSDEYSGDTYE